MVLGYSAGARSDLELLIAISNGVLFTPMHSWWGRIADEDMLLVTASVRALASEHPYFSHSLPARSRVPTGACAA